MSEFKTGQWAICDGAYVQIEQPAYRRGLMVCRIAGSDRRKCISIKRLTPSSLIPDFTNAKVGDECFSAEEGLCKIMDGTSGKLIAAMNEDGGWDAFTMNGKIEPESTHPLLFNSFAQFKAYWAEQALDMGRKGAIK